MALYCLPSDCRPALHATPKQRYRHGSETAAIPQGCQREAEWLAANGNTEHPSPLKAKEYRRIFQAFVGARKHHRADDSLKSYREIAKELRCKTKSVDNALMRIKRKVTAAGEEGIDWPFTD